MKKLFAGMVVSLLLVAMMGTTVFAATSPDAETALQKQSSELNKKITEITGIDSSGLRVQIQQSDVSTYELRWGKNVASGLGSSTEILAMADLKIASGSTASTGSVTVDLKVEKIRSGDNIHVFHYNESKNIWEDLNTVAGANVSWSDEHVKVTMSSFSPIMVVLVKSSSTSGSQTQTTPSGSGTTDTPQDSSQSNTQNGTDGTDSTDNNALDYTQGYNDGYEAGVASVQTDTTNSGAGSSKTSGNSSTTVKKTVTTRYINTGSTGSTGIAGSTSTVSPKTGASLPALPILAIFAFAGILACGKKAQGM
jgi:hypothetical protein